MADNNGQFTFTNVTPGPFQLTVSSPGFTTQTFSGLLHAGEVDVVPMIQLPLATAVTEVHVAAPTEELAEVQIQEQEKQRVLGVFPNFYVSYDPNAVALRPKQKFELAWKSTIDPVTFVLDRRGGRHPAIAKHLRRIRPGRAGLRQALRRRLCRLRHRHLHRRRDPALAPETGSALLL